MFYVLLSSAFYIPFGCSYRPSKLKDVALLTNVIIDYLTDRAPFADHAEQVLSLCESEEVNGFVTANAITDVYYVVRKVDQSQLHRHA